MHATARVSVELDPHGRSIISELRSQAPIRLIPRRSKVANPDGSAVVRLVESAAAPLGGDRLELRVRVGTGARLQLIGTGASLALPGHGGDYSHSTVHIEVEQDGTIEYLPDETIISERADHRAETHLHLAAGARARCREIVVLGRHAETPGRLTTTTHLLRTGTPLLRQRLDLTDPRQLHSPGYLAGAHVLATETIAWDDDPVEPADGPWWSLTPLAHGAALATALAADTTTAQQRLTQAISHHPSAEKLGHVPVRRSRPDPTDQQPHHYGTR
ncbi:MAG TPA: urease accessory protein UreD [Amycolatopsis sp.]|jgi:urease accessory protein|nr:urease accessory protein UreD [Amycolatopsis sp.]